MHLSLYTETTQILWIIIYTLLLCLIALLSQKAMYVAVIVALAYLLSMIPRFNYQSRPIGEYLINGEIIKVSKNYFVISDKGYNILVFSRNLSVINLQEGSSVTINGELNSNLKSFNLDPNFLKSNSVSYVLENPKIESLNPPIYNISNKINWYPYGYPFADKYWKTVVFGIYDSNNELINDINKLNVLHLLVISGLHFDILFVILFWIFKPLSKRWKHTNKFVFLIVFLYLVLLRSFISGIRSFVMQAVKRKGTIGKRKTNFLDGWATAIVIVFLLNYQWVFSLSFLISFMSSFFALCIAKLLSHTKIKRNIWKTLIISVSLYLINLPILLKINKYFNPFGLFFGVLLMPVFELTFFVSVFCFWSLDFINAYYYALDVVLNFLIANSYPLEINFKINWSLIFCMYIVWLSILALVKIKQKNQPKLIYG